MADVTHKATLLCPGLDGQEACSIGEGGERTFGEISGTVTVHPNGDRDWNFESWTCPICGREDGFQALTHEEVS